MDLHDTETRRNLEEAFAREAMAGRRYLFFAELAEGDSAELKSVVYLRGEGEEKELLTRSDAVLAILDDLGGLGRLLAFTRFVPRPIRDAVYDFIGRNRYRWFGRLDSCRLPREGEAARFLD